MSAFSIDLPGGPDGSAAAIRLHVRQDAASGTFWAESSDLDGLIVSGRDMAELRSEAALAAQALRELAR